MRSVITTALLAFAFALTGCTTPSAAASAVATSIASEAANIAVSHIGGVNVVYNPTTGVVTGGVTFKDGVYTRSVGPVCFAPADAKAEFRAAPPAGECVEDAPARGLEYTDNRAVTWVSTRALPIDQYGLRTVVENGYGVRAITGPLVSTKIVNRAMTTSARIVRDEEKETFKALKEIHDAENTRLKLVIRATNPSIWGSINRVFRGTPCISPIQPSVQVQVGEPASTYFPPQTSQNSLPQTPQSPTIPDPGLPPSGIMKSATDTDARLRAVEDHCKAVDGKLDLILTALTKK